MKAIFIEKLAVVRSIANCLNINNNAYQVVWEFGHFLELKARNNHLISTFWDVNVTVDTLASRHAKS